VEEAENEASESELWEQTREEEKRRMSGEVQGDCAL